MTQRPPIDYSEPLNHLRIEAETRAADMQTLDPSVYIQKNILHELQVHQIELEMQNEQLRITQTALEESRDRYVDLYEFAPVGYLTMNAQGVIVEANLKASAMLKVERKKLLQLPFAQWVMEEDKSYWRRQFIWMKALGYQEEFGLDIRLRLSDDAYFFAHLNCLRMNDQHSSNILRMTMMDISARKQAEADLRIAAIAFESQDGMIVTDAQNSILRVNHAFTKLTGYSAEEVLGKNPRMLMSGQHKASFYTAMWDSIHSTYKWEGEIWNRHKSGEIYLYMMTITAVKDPYGSVSHYVASIVDISRTN